MWLNINSLAAVSSVLSFPHTAAQSSSEAVGQHVTSRGPLSDNTVRYPNKKNFLNDIRPNLPENGEFRRSGADSPEQPGPDALLRFIRPLK